MKTSTTLSRGCRRDGDPVLHSSPPLFGMIRNAEFPCEDLISLLEQENDQCHVLLIVENGTYIHLIID